MTFCYHHTCPHPADYYVERTGSWTFLCAAHFARCDKEDVRRFAEIRVYPNDSPSSVNMTPRESLDEFYKFATEYLSGTST